MQTLIGIFNERHNANLAIIELERSGYNTKDISIVIKEEKGIMGAKGGAVVTDAALGASAGLLLGGLAGLLVGLGAIILPGVGAILVGGPIAAALGLTGAAATTISGAATGVLAGGLVGALVGLGLPEEVAREYQKKIKEGAVLLAVPAHSENDTQNIKEIFQRFNVDQIRII
ncbi:MAG: hypothetical protein HYT08_04685 [Candidatus Levybacteria bacterium]|nr:hypothetical protein [Candidatus Levybacteria bacterium]